MLPTSVPLALAGLWFYFAHPQGKQFRVLGWASLVLLAVIMFSANGRPYYVAPAYPMLFAAGGVAMEAWFSRRGLQWLKPTYMCLLLFTGAIGARYGHTGALPETYIRYSQRLHFTPPPVETDRLGRSRSSLPTFRMGGDDRRSGPHYNSLPPEVLQKRRSSPARTARPRRLICSDEVRPSRSHQPSPKLLSVGPRNYTGQSVIVLGIPREELERFFNSIEPAGESATPTPCPTSTSTIYYCRQPKISLPHCGQQSRTGLDSVGP